jgi:hypothetical protein
MLVDAFAEGERLGLERLESELAASASTRARISILQSREALQMP